jgi:ABC-2 type transport system permease protein
MNERIVATSPPTTSPNQLRALGALSLYPLIAMTRNVSTVAFGFLFPLVFLVVFGLIGERGSSLRLGITPSDTRLPLYGPLAQVPGLEFVEADERELDRRLQLGKLDAIVDIEGDRVLLRVNSASPQARIARLWVQAALDQLSLRAAGLTNPPYSLEVREVFGRRDRYIDFALIGQIGFAMMSTAIFGTVFGLLYLKKALILKRLFATPVHGITILLGQGLARAVIVLLQTALILVVGVVAFQFQLANGWITLIPMLLLTMLGLLVFLGFGLFIAGRTNDENAASPVTNFFTLPQFLLSGVFFPTDVFPPWLRMIADVLPLTYFNGAMRQIASEGAGLTDILPAVLGLCVWGVLSYALAAKTFKWV